MENRRALSAGANPVGAGDAYTDLLLDRYRDRLESRLRLFTSRLIRLKNLPETEKLKFNVRPAQDGLGEILYSARNVIDEFKDLAQAKQIEGERLQQLQIRFSLLVSGCRSPIKSDIDRCDDMFQLFSLDDLGAALPDLEKANPATTYLGKAVFALNSARKEVMSEADEFTFAINEALMANKCRDLRIELLHAQVRAALPVCGRMASCPHPTPADPLTKPVQASIITIPTVVIAAKFAEEPKGGGKAKDPAPKHDPMPTPEQIKALEDEQLRQASIDLPPEPTPAPPKKPLTARQRAALRKSEVEAGRKLEQLQKDQLEASFDKKKAEPETPPPPAAPQGAPRATAPRMISPPKPKGRATHVNDDRASDDHSLKTSEDLLNDALDHTIEGRGPAKPPSPPRIPKTGDPTLDSAQETLDRVHEILENTL
jgi:hypothetical protein